MNFLLDYILNTHHKYVTDNTKPLVGYTQKIADVHGDTHPELVEIAHIFRGIAMDLEEHLHKEEQILFPLIRQLVSAQHGGEVADDSCFGDIREPINAMEHEHTFVGNEFHKIVKLSMNYTLPADACATYSLAFKKLQEFENDLHQHIHLENNILFPKAIMLEN